MTRESLFRSVVDEITTTVYPRTGHRAALHAPSAFGIELTIVNLRTLTVDIPPQDVITKDNVTLRVNAVTYFNVVDPVRSVVAVQDHGFATFRIAQTTLRSILGQVELDDLLGKRDEINTQLQQIVDDVTNPWGVKVTLVEVKDVELPETMRRAMSRQAEAERERRAKVIHAMGELEAASSLGEAARTLERSPGSSCSASSRARRRAVPTAHRRRLRRLRRRRLPAADRAAGRPDSAPIAGTRAPTTIRRARRACRHASCGVSGGHTNSAVITDRMKR